MPPADASAISNTIRDGTGRKTVATIGCCLLNAIHQQEISMSMLFSPIELGPYQLSHRVAMAPLTRMRSDPGDIPSALMIEYYTQRASNVGLIISEAAPVSIFIGFSL